MNINTSAPTTFIKPNLVKQSSSPAFSGHQSTETLPNPSTSLQELCASAVKANFLPTISFKGESAPIRMELIDDLVETAKNLSDNDITGLHTTEDYMKAMTGNSKLTNLVLKASERELIAALELSEDEGDKQILDVVRNTLPNGEQKAEKYSKLAKNPNFLTLTSTDKPPVRDDMVNDLVKLTRKVLYLETRNFQGSDDYKETLAAKPQLMDAIQAATDEEILKTLEATRDGGDQVLLDTLKFVTSDASGHSERLENILKNPDFKELAPFYKK